MTWIVQNLWLIPALPLVAAGLSALATQPRRGFAASLAIGSMVIAFGLSCVAFVHTLGSHGETAPPVSKPFAWFPIGESSLQLGWILDPITAAMLVMITFVGTLIFIFSVGYMAHDENFTRFFCFLSLFAAAMLGLIIANSLLLLFMCWEVVGLASYLLIGFWYHKPSAAAAAKKAFITTRIGDVFFLLGIVWLYAETGTLLFYDNGNGCLEQSALAKLVAQSTWIGMGVSTAIALLIFCGAIGKSGQVPLHVWLPDAMEGPTPVSALIHAATMVAAGVFLVARMYPLMEVGPELMSKVQGSKSEVAVVRLAEEKSPSAAARDATSAKAEAKVGGGEATGAQTHGNQADALPLPKGEGRGEGEGTGHQPTAFVSTALQAVTWIGAITALFAALVAVAQTDIKRILAYSTVSQLGFMFMGLGVGGVAVGMFHLLTHAFFKALLFLGAGSVIHGCHEEQDIRRMGGLRKFMPVTFVTYAIGMMALSGVPLLFSGFWSKDEILHSAWLWTPSKWPFVFGIVGAFLTAFYMTRQMWFVFFAPGRTGFQPVPAHSKDSGAVATHSLASHHSGSSPADSHLGQAGSLSYAPHESPPVMTVPLGILAACAVLLSVFGTPAWPWFHSYLSGHGTPSGSASIPLGTLLVMFVSALIALGGIALGWRFYSRHHPAKSEDPDPLEALQPTVYGWLRGRFYFDELYAVSVVHWNAWCARTSRWLDEVIWDNAVVAVSYLVLGVSWLNRLFDEFVVNLGFDQGCVGLRQGARKLSYWQNGQIQRYLRVIGLALAVGALVFIWGCAP